MQTIQRHSVRRLSPPVSRGYFYHLADQNPTARERLGRLLNRSRSALLHFAQALPATLAEHLRARQALLTHLATHVTAALRSLYQRAFTSNSQQSPYCLVDDLVSFLSHSALSRFVLRLTFMLGIINSPFVSTTLLVPARVLAAALGAVMAYGAIAPKSADADLISIQNVSGQPAVVSGSEMFAKNQPEGLLYHDSGDQRWSTYLQQENPPGMGVNEDWLRIYSKQFSQYVGDGWEYRVDNRPFSGSDANQPFPLVGDIQGGAIAGSSLDGSYIRFEMQEGPDIDQGRQYYSWTMNLLQGVTFQDGTTTKSGVWDTASGSIHNLPALVGPSGDIDGQYFTIDVTPAIPEPSTTGLILTGLTAAAAYRRRSRRSRVSGA